MLTNILLGILIVGIGGVIAMMLMKKEKTGTTEEAMMLKVELDQTKKELGKMEREADAQNIKNGELTGKNKELWAQNERLEAKSKAAEKERDQLQRRIAKYEENEEHLKKEVAVQMNELKEAKNAFYEERKRIINDDEERRAEEQEERDRIWNDHENTVIAIMNELVMRPEYQAVFKGYSNTKLPDGFDGSLKPDFLIGFGEQYVIFDAKCTKSDDLGTYIRDAVKSTAKKVKGKAEIYPTLFFVVPTFALSSLKKTSFYELGFTFHVISPEALGPVVAILKRMTEYEFIEKMDPEERENIVSVLARHMQFISWKGAHDIIATQMGTELLRDTETVLPEIAKEAEMKKKKLGILKPKPSDILRLATSNDAREDIVKNLVSPKATITRKSLREAVEVELFDE